MNIETNAPYINHWKRLPDCVIQAGLHDSLNNDRAKAIKAKIERLLCISQSAFYSKLKQPNRFLITAEKIVIAMVYELEVSYLFPKIVGELNITS